MRERKQGAAHREVLTRIMDKERFLGEYRMQCSSEDACRMCPNYGNVWSCPPGLPDLSCYLEPYGRVCIVLLKVNYSEPLREEAGKTEEAAARIREECYETAKKRLFACLIKLEQKIPGSRAMGAGRCVLCERCAREEGKPCISPKARRYSITGFGIDFGKLTAEEFGIPMLWADRGLPAYDVAAAALFLPEER